MTFITTARFSVASYAVMRREGIYSRANGRLL